MKTKFLSASILLLSIIFTSCKNENKEKSIESNIVENFRAELDVSATKKDDFSMFYTEDNSTNFPTENVVWHGVSGGGLREKIIFNLTEDKVPTDIRLDFGLKKDQDSIILHNIKFQYYGNTFDIKGSDFFKYFVENKEFKTEVNPADQTLKILKSDSNYTPFFYPTYQLVDEIKKITKAK